MSRIGNKVINKCNTEIIKNDFTYTVKSNKGELEVPFFKNLNIEINDNQITVKRLNDLKQTKAQHGLLRSLLNNAILGVTQGFEKKMFLQGIGYRVQLKGKDLEFSLGYSHPVLFKAPKNISFKVDGQDKFSVSSIDKQLLGQVCANIKKLRKIDPYKGKGIFFENEIIKKKAGKSVK